MTHPILRAALVAAVLMALPVGRDGRAAELEVYRSFARDDGAYRVVVFRMPMERAFPGQSGDAPGVIRLFDAAGKQLAEAPVEMVQMVERVEWSAHHVSIKLLADWPLP
jgi:hypothetical protein